MKATIPKIGYKLIDLADYGGEGHLRIHGMTMSISQGMTDLLQGLAKKDGYDLSNIEKNAKEIDVKYMGQMMTYIASRCTDVEEEDGTFRPITSEEVAEMPIYLISDISLAAEELNQFPLVQKGGAESRREPPKPTGVE